MNSYPAAPMRPLGLAMTVVGLAIGLGSSQAHDWPSPLPPPVPSHAAVAAAPDLAQGQAWAGTLWAGPHAGAPAAPSARDCQRSPQTMEFAAPGGPSPQRSERRLGRHRAEAAGGSGALDASGASGDSGIRPGPEAAGKSAAREAAAPATAPAGAGMAAQPPMPSSARRPAQEPVTAGVVDDNADFGSYLAFRQRHQGLPVRQRDVRERYLLTVHDAGGRPVPDAQVQLYADARPLPLWARTDAGGQVWLHPRVAGITARVLEVQVHKAAGAGGNGELRGSALLQRGQRHQLQVTLDGRAPADRTRLDLVFLVDATGSMGDEIDKLKRSMRAMADQIAHLPSRPELCFGLVAYRDSGDEFFVRAHDFTDDLGAFQRTLGALHADGGGDYPEALNEAWHTAVHRLSWRDDGATRLVVLVADAPPQLQRGAPWYDDDMQAALARGIKLYAVGASGLDRVGEYVFRQAAQYTGGRFVFLTYAQAGDPASGPGRETRHEVDNYSVETLDKLVVRLVREELARRPG